MKNMKLKIGYRQLTVAAAFSLFAFAAITGCRKNAQEDAVSQATSQQLKQNGVKAKKNFMQVNLVGNNSEYNPARIDPILINAWGLAFSSFGTAWISATDGHVSTVYNGEGVQALPPVAIPSPTSTTGGSPTGQVFNAVTGDFLLPSPNGQTARFIFAGEDGVISGWNPTSATFALKVIDNSANAAYTGLAIATNGTSQNLYAANFKQARIDVFSNTWAPVSMSFTDPDLPSGYAPFNIQEIDGMLYVTYAKVAPDGEEEAGDGLGYVDIYSTNGTLVKRFVSGGQLNAPWGLSKAPAGFFDDEGENEGTIILVGNFGNGHINAYKSDGKFFGELWLHDEPIEIEGLWAIAVAPANATTLDHSRLYFTAGPDDETEGLFGYIKRK